MSIILFIFYGCMNVARKMILWGNLLLWIFLKICTTTIQQKQQQQNIMQTCTMDNIFDTIAIQLMALQSRDRDELSLSSPYHQHTVFWVLICILFLSGSLLLYLGPSNTPTLHQLSHPFVSLFGIQLLAEGAWMRDKIHFTAFDVGQNTILHTTLTACLGDII